MKVHITKQIEEKMVQPRKATLFSEEKLKLLKIITEAAISNFNLQPDHRVIQL